MSDESRPFDVDGVPLTLTLVRKRVKNVNARLRGSELRVSAPPGVSERDLEPMILQLARRLLRRARADHVNDGSSAEDLARAVARRFPQPPEVTRVQFSTAQRSRWGSYSRRTGVVRLNAALRLMPPWVLEAVVAHELAHVQEPDHSPAFWTLARSVCADTDRARAFLQGVSWLASTWDDLPPVERSQLAGRER